MAGRESSLSAAFVKRQNGLLERRGRANATGTQRRAELWSEEEASGDHVNEDDGASVLSSTVSGGISVSASLYARLPASVCAPTNTRSHCLCVCVCVCARRAAPPLQACCGRWDQRCGVSVTGATVLCVAVARSLHPSVAGSAASRACSEATIGAGDATDYWDYAHRWHQGNLKHARVLPPPSLLSSRSLSRLLVTSMHIGATYILMHSAGPLGIGVVFVSLHREHARAHTHANLDGNPHDQVRVAGGPGP